MSQYIRQYCSVSKNKEMDDRLIFELVDKEKARCWLQSVCGPTLVTPSFFEKMGFPPWFVRQYLKKHKEVLCVGGIVKRDVRGVSETDFLWGLADAIGADTSQARRSSAQAKRTKMCADACVEVLDRIDEAEQAAGHTTEVLMSSKQMPCQPTNIRDSKIGIDWRQVSCSDSLRLICGR